MTESQAGRTAKPGTESEPVILLTPDGHAGLPAFDGGWLLDGPEPAPFLSYAAFDPSVNWSDELEELHEESSRTHFIDRWTRSAMIERLGPLPPEPVIADIGCSTGFLLEDLRAQQPQGTLIGVDLVAAGLVKAHRLVPSARLIQADCCALPIADARIDAVVSANLLEHVPDDVEALRELARILRPGSRAVIVVPSGPGTYDYYDRFLGHERRYARGELAGKCRRAGLDVLEDGHIGSLLYPAFWLVKQRNRRVHAGLAGYRLQRQVAADIARTHSSRLGEIAWRVEQGLSRRGERLPFGIRSLVVARRPGGGR